MPLRRVRRSIQRERSRGRAFQPRFAPADALASWLGGLGAIAGLVLGNTLAAVIAVACVAMLGDTPLAMGLAVGLAIATGQLLRCLHPPSGAVALLGVLLGAHPLFVLTPVLSGSLLLVLIAVLFHRMVPSTGAYPHHWL